MNGVKEQKERKMKVNGSERKGTEMKWKQEGKKKKNEILKRKFEGKVYRKRRNGKVEKKAEEIRGLEGKKKEGKRK